MRLQVPCHTRIGPRDTNDIIDLRDEGMSHEVEKVFLGGYSFSRFYLFKSHILPPHGSAAFAALG